jgi:hypothetical protein
LTPPLRKLFGAIEPLKTDLNKFREFDTDEAQKFAAHLQTKWHAPDPPRSAPPRVPSALDAGNEKSPPKAGRFISKMANGLVAGTGNKHPHRLPPIVISLRI